MSSLRGKKIAILANGVRRLRASKVQEDNEDKGLEAESEDETLMDFIQNIMPYHGVSLQIGAVYRGHTSVGFKRLAD